MTVTPSVATVLAHLDLDRTVDLVAEVCTIPSSLGEEGPLASFLASVMSGYGFEGVDLQPLLDDRPNAVGEVALGDGPKVVMTGHMDIKPVSLGWSRAEPFSGEMIDGAVYGHGIMDMKAALACQIVAIEAVAVASGSTPGVFSDSMAMAAVSDHMGDQAGSMAYFDKYHADLCVLGELTDNQVCLGPRASGPVLLRHRHPGSVGPHLRHQAVNAGVLAAHVSSTAALMAPESRGQLTVTPNGTDIRLRHLAEEADARRMAEIVGLTASLIDDLADAGVVRLPADPWWRADDLAAACRSMVGTYNHPVGTCRMGSPGDPGTVVDGRLRVIGVEGLAVADASVMPAIPRAGTNLASMMIGQRAGKLLDVGR